MPIRRQDLMCSVSALSYDFDKRSGKLVMADGHCVDMGGCIALFSAIDAGVLKIETFSGLEPDTVYERVPAGPWDAV